MFIWLMLEVILNKIIEQTIQMLKIVLNKINIFGVYIPESFYSTELGVVVIGLRA
jgi:hypothetical protein